MNRYVNLVHHNPAIVMWYQQWSEPLFYSTQLPHVQALGAIPMITWDPSLGGVGIPLRAVASGRFDGYIRASADAANAWGRPIYIRFAHEMNLTGSPFGPRHAGDTPTSFRAAWRHVVTIFREQHATNVEWVWSPNVDCGGRCPFTKFYPGNAWVDWVGLDGYNYSYVNHDPWMSFAEVFGRSYRALTKISSKPVMIAETASAGKGIAKARWIADSFQTMPLKYPRIHAVVWFDRIKETNWMVNSSRPALAAWRHVVGSQMYAGSRRTLLAAAPLSRDVVTDPVAITARRLAPGAGRH